jgi:hypothetical protein
MIEVGPPPRPVSPVVPRANDVYQGVRLVYTNGFEDAFLEHRRVRELLLVTVPCVVFGLFLSAVVQGVLVATGTFGDDWDNDDTALLTSTGTVAFLAGFLAWSVRRRKIGIASWQVVVDDRASSAGAARELLRLEVARRLEGVRWSRSEMNRRGRYALRIRYRTYACYVSVFPFGTDLFVGWAMLDEPHFWNVLGDFVADLFRTRGWFGREMRSYTAKALRDSVHNATRDAVAASANGASPRPAP